MTLKNAKDGYPIYQAQNLPDVSSGVEHFLQSVQAKVIAKTMADGRVTEKEECTQTKAVKQPFTSQQLQIKPEGQRAWKWFTLHTLTNLELKPDDVVILWTTRYRVMQKYDYCEYGYYQYEIVEDYTS